MIKLDSNLMKGFSPGSLNQNGRLEQAKQQQDLRSEAVSPLKFARTEASGFNLFHRSIQHHLHGALPGKDNPPVQDLEEQELAEREERASLAATNILNFIGRRLQQDQRDGASQQQLESRLNAAIEGFHKGYEEANGILEDMQLLSPKLEQDIGLTKEKVLSGIDDFKRQFLEGVPPEQIAQEKQQTQATAQLDITQQQVAPSRYRGMQVGEARDFSFTLQTKDGDVVTINASSLMAMQHESGQTRFADQGQQYQMDYQSTSGYQQSNFAFSVKGELDEDELAAINSLLNNVNDMADDFYNGDLSKALEKAQNLDFNSQEISGFAISMAQVQQVNAIQAYHPEQEILKPNIMAELKPIGKFALELARSLTVANELFAHPRELLNSLAKQMGELHKPADENDKRYDFYQVSQSILDGLAENKK